MPEKLTTFDKLHDEENSVFVLENIVHSNNKRMINFVQDFFFEVKGLKGVVVKHSILSNTLHCVNLTGRSMQALVNFTEGALSYNSKKFKVLERG